MSATGQINQDAADKLLNAWEEEKLIRVPETKVESRWANLVKRGNTIQR